MPYVNYHKHSMYSNIITTDSAVTNEDYCKRAVELGHQVVSSCEHGTPGNYRQLSELAAQYGLKWRYVMEGYFVKYRDPEDIKDKTNCHMILAAKTAKGIGDLNELMSEANLTGYYYKPRFDLDLLLKLDPKDVFVTTACVAGIWKYGEKEATHLIHLLRSHFRDSFMLEVQAHNTDSQKEVNRMVLDFYRNEGIPIIAGMDSHFIYPQDKALRDQRLGANHIVYEDEDGWDLDYPSDDEAFQRFVRQGVLSKEQIAEALGNTEIFLDFEDVVLDKSMKLPTIYPNLSQEERNEKYRQLIREKWLEYRKTVPQERWPEYEAGIKYEVDTITETNMSDYFLLDYELVKRGKELGGMLTYTGRGCFTESARITTIAGLKPIADVVPGDIVIDKDGEYRKVLDTFAYDIDEPLIEIQATANKMFGAYPTCTTDHRVLVARENGEYEWVKARDLNKGDLLCVPKMSAPLSRNQTVDLGQYLNRISFVDGDLVYESHTGNGNNGINWKDLVVKYGISKPALGNFFSGRTPCIVSKGPGKRFNDTKLQIISDFGCASHDELIRWYKKTYLSSTQRYIEKDALFYEFLGMMYGDGWVVLKKSNTWRCGLALNSDNDKNIYNRKVFQQIADRLGARVSEKKENGRKLIQLQLHCSSFAQFLGKTYFTSNKGKAKNVPEEIFYLDAEKSQAFLSGLMHTDGCTTSLDRTSFDNTSLPLINAFHVLCMKTNNMPPRLTVRNAWMDKRGYNCKTSYKWTTPIYNSNKGMFRKISEDERYWLIPVTGIKLLPKRKCRVYDLHVESSHSFLLNNMIVHNSAPSYCTNMLLGFTSIDRFTSPITMYPDRFISKDRLLSGSTPDIDMNCGDVEPFAKAQSEIMGPWHSAPMVAFGTLKRLSAWKMYCRAADVPFSIANELGEALKRYELDVKHADEDEEEPDIMDYVPAEYRDHLKMSEKYLGLVDSISPHPCAHVVTNLDIRREYGVIRLASKTGKKKVVYAAFVDGQTCERFGGLKNDLLKVDVVKVNADIYKRIGIPQPTVPQLMEIVNKDKATWEMYAKGYTLGLNQAEQEKSTQKVMRYRPRNVSEMSAFVAGIRPGFQSMVDKLLDRQHFDYGIPALDKLLQTKEMGSSFILYQEQVMGILQYAGFKPSESYAAIKAIAKKHPEKVLPMKERFLEGFSRKLIEESGATKEKADELSTTCWGIVDDNTQYSFNASHSLSVALDSLYTAWAKAHYPYETYVSLLESYSSKGDKARIAKAKTEMNKAFGITVTMPRFRQDNRGYYVDKANHTISDSLISVKHLSARVADALYKLRNEQYDCFVDLLHELVLTPALNTQSIAILIRMGYFEEFGSTGRLLNIWREFTEGENRFSKSHVKATQERRLDALRQYEKQLPECTIPVSEVIQFEIEYFGVPYSVFPKAVGQFAVLDVDTKYSPKVKLYNIAKGTEGVMKIRKATFADQPLEVGNVLRLDKWKSQQAYQYANGKAIPKPGVNDLWLEKYTLLNGSENNF